MDPTLPKVSISGYSARISLAGRVITLGPAGSREAAKAYDRIVALYLANGRRLPSYAPPALTVGGLAEQYFEFAHQYFRKHGRQTASVLVVKRALELFLASHDKHPAADVGPRALRDFQRDLAAADGSPLARGTINRYVKVVQQMFRWAQQEELLPPGRWTDLGAVRPL
ncbi:MAG: hypothetical protein WAZ94_11500, partial [Phycisphaerales bacterium]